MKLEYAQFQGIAPGIAPRKLAQAMATIAENCRFDRGRIDPWPGILDLAPAASTSRSVFPYNGSFLLDNDVRSYVRRPYPNDVLERIIYTDSDYPKIRSGSAEYRLGIPEPVAPLTAVATIPGDQSVLTNVETWSYVYTFVDDWGIEGRPSDPSNSVTVGLGATVDLSFPAAPTGNYNFGVASRRRIYRTNAAGNNLAYFQFVGEMPLAQTAYTDSTPSDQLEEVLPSATWYGPPNDDSALFPGGPLQGICRMAGDFLAGFSGDTVFFSEVAVPTAWPYYRRVGAQIRAIVAVADGLFIGTDSTPYIAIGSTPENIVVRPLESTEACLSSTGMVDMGAYALYPGPNGLVRTDAQAPQNISAGYFTPETWRALQPETFRAFRWQGRYLAFFGAPEDGNCLVYDPNADTQAFYTFTGFRVNGGYTDPDTDRLYVIYRNDNDEWRVGAFGEGATLTLRWQGRQEIFPIPTQMKFLRVFAESYPVTVTGMDPGGVLFTKIVNDDMPYSLPEGYRSRYLQILLEAQTGIDRVVLATALSELQ